MADLASNVVSQFDRNATGVFSPVEVEAITNGPNAGAFCISDADGRELTILRLAIPNAHRANVDRERRTCRLRAGRTLVVPAYMITHEEAPAASVRIFRFGATAPGCGVNIMSVLRP